MLAKLAFGLPDLMTLSKISDLLQIGMRELIVNRNG